MHQQLESLMNYYVEGSRQGSLAPHLALGLEGAKARAAGRTAWYGVGRNSGQISTKINTGGIL
jgi:hypothetical protein